MFNRHEDKEKRNFVMAGATLVLSYLKLVGGKDTTTAPEDNKGGAILVESGTLNLLYVVLNLKNSEL